MKGKLLFVVGLGVGYVLGTRAGRERYEQIAKAADRVWNQPAVQQGVDTVKDFAASKLGDVSDTVLDGVKQLIGNQTSKNRAAKPTPARAGASTTAAKSNGSTSTAAKSNGSGANGAKANGAKVNGSKADGSSSSSGPSAASDS